MRLLAAALLLLSRACIVAQDLPLTPGRSLVVIECTLSDAEQYEAYDEQQCRQLDDAARVLVCTQCCIDGAGILNRVEREISNMLIQQKAAGVRADCDESADTFFNKLGIFYDQPSKEAWRRKCYEKMGGNIKPEDLSAPFHFDLDKKDDSGEDAAGFSIFNRASWPKLNREIGIQIDIQVVVIVGVLFGILAGAFGALYTKWVLTPDVRPTCRCKALRARCRLYDYFHKKGYRAMADKHYNERTEDGLWVRCQPPAGPPVIWKKEGAAGGGRWPVWVKVQRREPFFRRWWFKAPASESENVSAAAASREKTDRKFDCTTDAGVRDALAQTGG